MSKEEQRKVPVLRFKGFTDDWEQRKLGDIAKRVIRKNKENDILPVLTNSADLGIVLQNDYFDKAIAKNLNNYYIVSHNDFVYNPRISKKAPFGPINRNKLNIQGVMSPLYLVFRFNSEMDLNFLEYYFQSSKWYPFMYKNGDSGARADRFAIKNSVLMNMTINVPTLDQQKRIGKILLLLENSIALQQRKLSLIEKLRENISEHIFSPDIMKFKNIDPEFEIKKLSDISNIFIGLVTTMTKNYAKNGILLIRNSNIKENNFKFDNYIYLDSKFAEKNKNREMKIGDVVTVHTGDIGTSAVIEPKEENSIGFATITTRPNNKIINSYYLSDYLNTKKHKNWAVRMSTGDGRRNYNLKDFTRIRLNVPSLNYQIKIVALIKYLESFSKSEKKKINQLNSLKQFLLQNLFI